MFALMEARRARSAILAAVVVALSAPFVRAQEAPVATPNIVPPRLVGDSVAIYPEQALQEHLTGSVTIALILDIDVNGSVGKVTLMDARGHDFDEAAAAAAQNLILAPPGRGGRAGATP